MEDLIYQLELEEVACPLCGEVRGKLLFQFKRVSLLECSCGLYYFSPRYTFSSRRVFRGRGVGGSRADGENLYSWMFRQNPKFKSCMIFGCGSGEVMQPFVNEGKKVYGHEMSRVLARRASEKGLSVVTVEPFKLKFSGSIDGVIFWNSFCYYDNPVALLRFLLKRASSRVVFIFHLADANKLVENVLDPFWDPYVNQYVFPKGLFLRVLKERGFEVKEKRSGYESCALLYASRGG